MVNFSLTSKGIDTSRFERRLKTYVQNVKGALSDSWSVITAEVLGDVASRAPSPGLEYELVMYGEDGQGSLPSDTTGTFRPSDLERIRFIRGPGMWIQEAVMAPGTYVSDSGGLSLQAGSVSALQAITQFSWQNYSSKIGAIQHTSEYGLFELFEYGNNILGWKNQQAPRFGDQNYYLSPDVNVRVRMMQKTYPTFGMFTAFNREIFNEAVKSRARAVEF